ncbi:hypothetical protein KIPB_004061 [Kipferlia bialata]|uniref:Muskelin N-terminal domain-containing protein n=1 Tax=Kipferlia bialata TaxID=797122 RepID=A0A9K3CTC6_9EUKA|nr:hypothetical protein KIPB_004061 [Kipferlia bialata]|eukprot:g4061.t1
MPNDIRGAVTDSLTSLLGCSQVSVVADDLAQLASVLMNRCGIAVPADFIYALLFTGAPINLPDFLTYPDYQTRQYRLGPASMDVFSATRDQRMAFHYIANLQLPFSSDVLINPEARLGEACAIPYTAALRVVAADLLGWLGSLRKYSAKGVTLMHQYKAYHRWSRMHAADAFRHVCALRTMKNVPSQFKQWLDPTGRPEVLSPSSVVEATRMYATACTLVMCFGAIAPGATLAPAIPTLRLPNPKQNQYKHCHRTDDVFRAHLSLKVPLEGAHQTERLAALCGHNIAVPPPLPDLSAAMEALSLGSPMSPGGMSVASVLDMWSSNSGSGHQYLILELPRFTYLTSILFGKYKGSHVCNLKEFVIHTGPSLDTLEETLHAGLRNDADPEAFSLRPDPISLRQPAPVRFVRIQPLAAHGPNYNFSIWHVELRGTQQPEIVQRMRHDYLRAREAAQLTQTLLYLRNKGLSKSLESVVESVPHALTDGAAVIGKGPSALWDCIHSDNPGSVGLLESYIHKAANTGALATFCRSVVPSIAVAEIPRPSPTLSPLQSPRGSGPAGQWPKGRAGHQLVLDPRGDCAWLFGGFDGSVSFNDMWRLDMVSLEWQCVSEHHPTATDRPSPRSCHKMCIDPDTGVLYIFGNHLSQSAYSPSDLWEFDTHSCQFNCLCDNCSDNGPPLLYDAKMLFHRSKKGYGFSATAGKDLDKGPSPCLYVLGGQPCSAQDGADHKTVSVYKYDLGRRVWSRMLVSGTEGTETKPHALPRFRPRFSHSAEIVYETPGGDPIVAVFGGLRDDCSPNDTQLVNLNTGDTWVVCADSSAVKCPAAGASHRSSIDPNTGDMLLWVGLQFTLTPTHPQYDPDSHSLWRFMPELSRWERLAILSNGGEGVDPERANQDADIDRQTADANNTPYTGATMRGPRTGVSVSLGGRGSSASEGVQNLLDRLRSDPGRVIGSGALRPEQCRFRRDGTVSQPGSAAPTLYSSVPGERMVSEGSVFVGLGALEDSRLRRGLDPDIRSLVDEWTGAPGPKSDVQGEREREAAEGAGIAGPETMQVDSVAEAHGVDAGVIEAPPTSPTGGRPSQKSVEHTLPPIRFAHQVVFDPRRSRLILFGGNTSTRSQTRQGDMWVASVCRPRVKDVLNNLLFCVRRHHFLCMCLDYLRASTVEERCRVSSHALSYLRTSVAPLVGDSPSRKHAYSCLAPHAVLQMSPRYPPALADDLSLSPLFASPLMGVGVGAVESKVPPTEEELVSVLTDARHGLFKTLSQVMDLSLLE